MEWNRSETLALAQHQCTYCHGMGLIVGKRGRTSPCNCVFRAIFRACLDRFRQCEEKERHMSQVTYSQISGRVNRMSWGRKDEEYMADFYLVSKRHLDGQEFELFKYHFLYAADWKLCCRFLKIDRGTFFHAVYRIQQRLGRVFRELEPHPLFPLDEYFACSERAKMDPLAPPEPPDGDEPKAKRGLPAILPPKGPRPLRPPLAVISQIETVQPRNPDELFDLPLAA